MKKILTTLASALFVLTTAAQTEIKEYDYVWLQSFGLNTITIVTPDTTQIIEFKIADYKKESNVALRKSMQLVQQYEREGWEFVDVMMQPGTAFLMRKPKQ